MFEGNELLSLIERLRGSFFHRADNFVVNGVGTIGTLPKFIGTLSIGDSIITESGAAISVAGAVTSVGNLTLSGVARRIIGDMDNATIANRLFFVPSVVNAAAFLGLMPNGTGTQAIFRGYGGSDPANASFLSLNITSTAANIVSYRAGSGVTVPLVLIVDGTDAMRLTVNRAAIFNGGTAPTVVPDAAGNVEINGSVAVKGGYFTGNMDTMTYAAAISLNVALGNLHKTTTVHATGNATINASGVGVAGQQIRVLIINDATGAKTITFGTNFKPSATVVGTISKAALVTFESDGINWYEAARTLNL